MATVPTDMMVIAERIPAMILILILLVFFMMISPFRFDFVFPLLWLYSITLTFATSLQISVKKFISIFLFLEPLLKGFSFSLEHDHSISGNL
jgi:hypothetical protein